MSRDRTRTRDRSDEADTVDTSEFDVGADVAGEATAPSETGESAGLRGRLAARTERLFSPRAFLAILLLSVAGLFTAGTFLPLPGSGLLGVFLATFAFGLVASDRRYAEAAVAGGITVGASAFLDAAVVAFLGGFGVSLALLGGGVGAAVAVVGTYFGRDLRAGLTREI
ncbi:hypothetical protein [Natronomonas gomsonensis]|uniref:hypothetical protein n=1 Tax=Natronomonas gomsonensis TaxID=1046043 RepID=UPI0015BC6E77|nr:hypothetical protein [Natronomonas gomsonensis]